MEIYANKKGTSGVKGYEIAQDSITVYFKNSSVYLYNAAHPGSATVAEMQKLARRGEGLNDYINQHVKADCFVLKR